MKARAIQTKYNGNLFRSLLEARWAIFFDALKIKYRYEQFGFDLQDVWYCPDFFLPDLRIWVEIKGEYPSDEAIHKAKLLASARPVDNVAIFWGGLPDEAYEPIGMKFFYRSHFDLDRTDFTNDISLTEADKVLCIERVVFVGSDSDGWWLGPSSLGHEDGNYYYTLMQAFDEARQYRFW